MEVKKCINCKKIKEIVFLDYDRKIGAIKVCHSCAHEMRPIFDHELKRYIEEIDRMILCSSCSSKFLPKWANQYICTNCYIAKKKKKEALSTLLTQTKVQVIQCKIL